ncbi:hypothetical protein BDK51DRAFT_33732, partial [Blyttiomyces helicus]
MLFNASNRGSKGSGGDAALFARPKVAVASSTVIGRLGKGRGTGGLASRGGTREKASLFPTTDTSTGAPSRDTGLLPVVVEAHCFPFASRASKEAGTDGGRCGSTFGGLTRIRSASGRRADPGIRKAVVAGGVESSIGVDVDGSSHLLRGFGGGVGTPWMRQTLQEMDETRH